MNIECIYVSPLYRSLETAKYMIEDNPNFKGEIIVHPLIIECLNCIDDIIYDIKETKINFKKINNNVTVIWDIFDKYVHEYQKWNENFFYFEYFNILEENEKNIKYNKLLDLYNKRDMNNFKIETVNEIPKNIFKNDSLKPFESFKHVYWRFLEFKKNLIEKHNNSLNDFDRKILVVTHGDFLGVISNKFLYETDDVNFYPKDCCHCKNCDIISIYI